MSDKSKPYPALYEIKLTLDPAQEAYTGFICAHYSAPLHTTNTPIGTPEQESLLMHARDLLIHACTRSIPGTTDHDLSFTLKDDLETLQIHAPAIHEGHPVGEFSLNISFSGTLHHDNRGIYLAGYQDQGISKNAIVSQFEENDARKAFPCFDEPAAKAVFRISLIIPSHCSAISNGDIASEQPVDEKHKLVVFQDTPIMSSYLVFIGVGEFSTIERTLEGISFRAHAVGGKAHLATHALDFAAESLLHLIEYTGVRYPFQKLDLIACPDFAFGAMENFAAISYRENLMLFDPATGSRDELERIGQVTSHEVAHMWFGDLVSPDDWGSIWLNESMATYFGYLVNETTHPEWSGMKRFMLDSFQSAMERDSLENTIAIEFPDGNTYEMSPAVTPIIYSKAASVLRMFHHYLGDHSFKEVIRSYLETYAYGIAGSDQFLDCFVPYIDKTVPATWMRRAGFPVVHAEKCGNCIRLSQQRFNLCAEVIPNANDDTSPPWPIPLFVSIIHAGGTRDERKMLFDTQEMELAIDLDGDTSIVAVELNTARSGFYRVSYSTQLLERLGRSMQGGLLDEIERAGIVDDLFAFLHAGIVEPALVLEFVARWYTRERSYLPLAGLARALTLLHALVVGNNDAQEAIRATIATTASRLLSPWLTEHGTQASPDEPFYISYLRTEIMSALFHMKDSSVLEMLATMKANLVKGIAQNPNIEGLILKAGAATDLKPDYFFSRLDQETDEAKKVRILSALLSFRDARDIEQVFTSLEKQVPARNWATVIAQARLAPKARAVLLDWYRKHYDSLDSIHPFTAARIMQEVIIWGCLGQHSMVTDEIRHTMLAQKHASPETIQMGIDYLKVYNRTAGR